ncbi:MULTISPECIES: ParB/RepB/Spo0J family partition protein [Streptomycetaceae]|uniref:Gp1 n=1 Tax=Streptantibioticus cattleyicolor (strain ATCC 35852 / DSM 46488 / JCM 4925 / NBRC 14057 / NRRL 8057) TaxID=1003195 RepID=F8JT19_STREN
MPAEYVTTRDVPLDELMLFPGNAKRGDVEAIRQSLRRNGQYRSLIVREIPSGPLIVLAGNHTLQALAAEGAQTARCEIVRCDDAEARRINLADNRLAELGTYDNDALAELLSYLDGDYTGTGYTETDVEMLITPPPDLDALAAEFGEPEDDDLWPVLRFKVPPNVRDDFYDLSSGCETPDDDAARFIHLMNKLRSMA